MRLYQGKTLVASDARPSDFMQYFGEALAVGVCEPFLMVRDDDARMEVVTNEGRLMLCVAWNDDDFVVSNEASYVESELRFQGLSGIRSALYANFVEAEHALRTISSFFTKLRLTKDVEFQRGLPDPEILQFPAAISDGSQDLAISGSSLRRPSLDEIRELMDEIAANGGVQFAIEYANPERKEKREFLLVGPVYGEFGGFLGWEVQFMGNVLTTTDEQNGSFVEAFACGAPVAFRSNAIVPRKLALSAVDYFLRHRTADAGLNWQHFERVQRPGIL